MLIYAGCTEVDGRAGKDSCRCAGCSSSIVHQREAHAESASSQRAVIERCYMTMLPRRMATKYYLPPLALRCNIMLHPGSFVKAMVVDKQSSNFRVKKSEIRDLEVIVKMADTGRRTIYDAWNKQVSTYERKHSSHPRAWRATRMSSGWVPMRTDTDLPQGMVGSRLSPDLRVNWKRGIMVRCEGGRTGH